MGKSEIEDHIDKLIRASFFCILLFGCLAYPFWIFGLLIFALVSYGFLIAAAVVSLMVALTGRPSMKRIWKRMLLLWSISLIGVLWFYVSVFGCSSYFGS